jgi:alkanesulfonate monooxygenase SsuD/methylene tetrahydromethanopterin reductase-like flavin-dependent oxidoreductase (luciferase family)
VGTAVALVRIHHPTLLAEQFRFASAVARGRLDVGLGRGDVSGAAASQLDSLRKTDAEVDRDIGRVVSALTYGSDVVEPAAAGIEYWLHGAGTRSATLAGELNLNYCHALFLNADIDAAISAFARYRACGGRGRTAVAVAVALNEHRGVAVSDAHGHRFAVTAGTAAYCARALSNARRLTSADEIIIAEVSQRPTDHLSAIAAPISERPGLGRGWMRREP